MICVNLQHTALLTVWDVILQDAMTSEVLHIYLIAR